MAETQTNDNFDFELVSPERKLMSEKAWQVTIPGFEGDFGVRAGHSSLVSNIRPGIVEIVKTQGGDAEKIFIAGGFADVTATNCTVLAEEALPLEELNQGEIEKEVETAQKLLDNAKDDVETIRFTKQLTLAKAKLTAVTGSLSV
jgi:F-type H+-transporting ATPase subunit epsilon